MKIKVLALASIFSLSIAGSSFAAVTWGTAAADGSFTIGNTANGPQLVIKPSANVKLGYESTSGISYSVGTYHSSGTKSYGTTNGDTRIYMYENVTQASAQVPPADPNTSAGTTTWGAGWTAMK
jgi:hypothetical protein